MGFIEARIGITNLGENYRSLGFFPPLPQIVIDKIHGDEHTKELGLPYIRLKNLKTPDGVTYTETTTICGRLNPTLQAKEIASRILMITQGVEGSETEGWVNENQFKSDRHARLFGETAVSLTAQEPLSAYEAQAPLAA